MTTCPFCNTLLTDSAAGIERCFSCGRAVDIAPTVEFRPAKDLDVTDDFPQRSLAPTDQFEIGRAEGESDPLLAETGDIESPIAETIDLPVPPDSPSIDATAPVPFAGSPHPDLTATGDWYSQRMDDEALQATWSRAMATPDSAVDPSSFATDTGDVAEEHASDWLMPEMSLMVEPTAGLAAAKCNLVIQQRTLQSPIPGSPQDVDYDLLQLLGQGGMGMVYAARQASIDRVVAIKTLKPDRAQDRPSRDKFLSEACVTGELEHPNIVPIYDVGRNADGSFFYAMKRVKGTAWDDVIRQNSEHDNIDVLLKVCDAMAFAHSKGIVHRDLKPDNIMLGNFGEVLVMDWGLAIPADSRRLIGGMVQEPNLGGTPAYMAPEMAAGPYERIGPASDIYLLGAILYEFVTGKRAHTGKNFLGAVAAAANNDITPTDKKGELVDIALHAMEFNPANRYASVQDFQKAIRGYQSHLESITLSKRAAGRLETAIESQDYQDFSAALFGFQESLDLWSRNERAKSGLAETQLAYGRAAKEKGDYDLGAGLLDEEIAEHQELYREIVSAWAERDARKQRLKRYKRIGIGLAATLFLVIAGAAGVFRYQQGLTEAQRVKAVAAKEEADTQRAEAEKQRGIAFEARDFAEEKRMDAEVARNEAELARDAEKTQRELADKRRIEAEEARRREAYEAYVARIGAAVSKIEENAFDGARALLEQCKPKNDDDEDFRNWEWRRLMYVCEQGSDEYQVGGALECVDWYDDGEVRRFAAAGTDGTVQLWEPFATTENESQQSGKFKLARKVLVGHQIFDLAFSPDGTDIALGTGDKSAFIKKVDVETGEVEDFAVGSPESHRGAVLSVEFSDDGKRLLTASQDGTGKIWDADSDEPLATLHGHRLAVWQATFFPSSDNGEERILTVSQDGNAIVWFRNPVADRWQAKPAFVEHEQPIYAGAVSPDGKLVAIAGHDQRIFVWDPDDLDEFDFQRALDPQASPDATKTTTPHRTFVGHVAEVRSLQFSSDGATLISGSHDNSIRIWNVKDGKSRTTLRGHGEWVRDCRLSLDSATLVSAAYDGTVRSWDINGYEEERVLRGEVIEGHDDAITWATFSPLADRILTASRDRTLKLWSETGDQVQAFREGHSFLASQAVFFDGGKRLATAAVDRTVRVWDVESGAELHVLSGTGRSTVIAAWPNGTRLVTGGPFDEDAGDRSYSARVWDTQSGELIRELKGQHRAQVSAVAVSRSGDLVFTGDGNGEGRIWNAGGKLVRDEFSPHRDKIIGAAFVDEDRTLITGSLDGLVRCWNVNSWEEDESRRVPHGSRIRSVDFTTGGRIITTCGDKFVRTWDFRAANGIRRIPVNEAAGHVAISPDGKSFLTVFQDNTIHKEKRIVRVFDWQSGQELTFPQSPRESGPFLHLSRRSQLRSAAFAPDGKHVLTVGGDQVQLWELNDRQPPFRRRRMNFSTHGVVSSANFSADGKRIVSGSRDGTANIWDTATNTSLIKLLGKHAGSVNHAAFSPDDESQYVVTASADGTAVLWDVSDGDFADADERSKNVPRKTRFVRRFSGHAGSLYSAAFSHDGTRIVTASADRTVRIWDVQSGECLRKLSTHEGEVHQAVFSHDDTRVVSGGADNQAIVWDLQSGEELTLQGHTASVTAVAFNDDSSRVLTGSKDFTVKVWDVSPEEHKRGTELLTLRGHNREVSSVSFPEGRDYVLTGSYDGSAIVWLATSAERQQLVRERTME